MVMLPKMVGDMPDFHPCLKKPSSVIYWKLCVYTSICIDNIRPTYAF